MIIISKKEVEKLEQHDVKILDSQVSIYGDHSSINNIWDDASIYVVISGYLHNTNVHIYIVNDGKHIGWEALERNIQEGLRYMRKCFELCEGDFAYSHQKHI